MPQEDKIKLKFLKEIKNNPCIINLRSNRKLRGIVKFIDHHFNMVLTDVVEIRKIRNKNKGVKKKEGGVIERKIKYMILRGDNVISMCDL